MAAVGLGSHVSNTSVASSQRWLSASNDSWGNQRGSTLNTITDEDYSTEDYLLSSDRQNDSDTTHYGAISNRLRMMNRFLIRRRGHIRSRQFPSGRASILVLFLAISERFVFYGAVNGVLDLIPGLGERKGGGFQSFLAIFLYYCVGRLFYPVGGFLADVYLGRYRVIHLSLWLYWIAFALLEIAHLLQFSNKTRVISEYPIPILSYILIVLASGGFQSTIIPFGADQIEGGSSNQLSSFLYWLYFADQVGILCSVIVSGTMSSFLPNAYIPIFQVFVALLVVTTALLLHNCLHHWYLTNIVRENCIKTVAQVLWYAARVKRHLPQHRRAFRYGEGKQPRIELAKVRYDGIFPDDHVEDVKTFCRICLLLFSLGGFFFSLSGWTTAFIDQMNYTLTEAAQSHSQAAKAFIPNIYVALNTLSLMVFLPLVNHLLVPCLPFLTIRGKMAVGFVITILSLSITLVVENRLSDQSPLHRTLLIAVPAILLTLPEVFVKVSALEFVYAQSPESMRGILISIFYFIRGVFSGGSSITYFIACTSNRQFFFFIILLVFTVVWFVKYIIVACLYVNHQRPNRESDEHEEISHVYNIVIH